MGYTATRAGEALAGGGLALLVVMPLAGIATGRLPARNMAAFGFACFACAFYYTSTHFTLTMTFGFASWLRILQMSPRSTRLPLTSAEAAKGRDPASWHKLPFISSSISKLRCRLIRTSW
jgi:hypothetical protein